MPATVSTVLLTTKGEYRRAQLALSGGNLEMSTLQKYFKRKEQPEEVATYTMDDRLITLFGYKKGKKGSENKTIFPFPSPDMTIYGDVIVIVHLGEWEQPLPITVDQWAIFHQRTVTDHDKDDGDEKDEDDEEKEDKEKDEEEEEEAEEEEKDEDEDEDEFPEVVEEEEEPEPEPEPVRKPRRSAYPKLDPNALKSEITLDQASDTHPTRMLCLRSLSFLEDIFPAEEIQALERSIFEVTFHDAQRNYIPLNWRSPLFSESYRQTLRSILSNLHPKSPVNNPRLLHRIKDGEFPLSMLPTLSPYEMYPENWFMLKDKLVQREQKILEGNKSRATDQFKCRRCQKRECTYYELQTRSADEPMTIFITCLNCGKEWRQGG